jgi:putative transposase
MTDILALLQPLNQIVAKTTLRQMSVIMYAMLAMTGRVTMLGLSRWTDKGGSYRTVQRFFQTTIPWAQVMWSLFCTHLRQAEDVYVLAGDECVVTKSGKQTHGLDRFFSSLFGKPVPGVALFGLSLVSIRERRACPVMVEQVVRSVEEKAAAKEKARQKKSEKQEQKKKPGRPKGSKNRNKRDVTLTPELKRIQGMIKRFLSLAGNTITVACIAMDGHFGNNNALQMVQQCGLHLVSKLRCDAALHFLYEGDNKQQKYGNRVDYGNIPAQYLQQSTTTDGIRTDIYQAVTLHKEFAQPLNVVVIVKTKLSTGATAHVILFSSDLQSGWAQILDYYQLRFQIEFNFRDAKQYWGLEDFMNVRETPVTNAINLSLFMVSLSQLLLRELRQEHPMANVLDLKAFCRGHKYVAEVLKLLPEKPDPILSCTIFATISQLGRVHTPQPSLNPP